MSHYFIGIKVPETIGRTLHSWQHSVKPHVSYNEWVHEEDFHLTLKFLGAVEQETLSKLNDTLSQLNGHAPLDLTINGLNYFGKPDQPRVLYAEVERTKPLSRLKSEVENVALACGFMNESRPYKPHITLAKKWHGGSIDKRIDQLEAALERPLHWQANAFQLFHIDPNTQPKYRIVQTCHLEGKGESSWHN
ncbi:2'-5' RNA ligase [Alkalibacillus flavidus]|uniref:RNA 2',3'-cyclic phosphodiesterase n=1 Tax=Alkalibacillus flavidus TaxID=546021 RepID=A0ABV2KSY4_9BACI